MGESSDDEGILYEAGMWDDVERQLLAHETAEAALAPSAVASPPPPPPPPNAGLDAAIDAALAACSTHPTGPMAPLSL